MQISEITAAATPVATQAQTVKSAAAEFDAMVIEMLLRQSGLLQSLMGESESGTGMLFAGDMFLQTFAKDLAMQMQLGYGNLLVQQAAGENS